MTAPFDRLPKPLGRYIFDCAGAQLEVHPHDVAIVVRVRGEIDASNADLVARAIRRCARNAPPLILDLRHLKFLASSGFSALQLLTDELEHAELHFSVVSGGALHRLTHVIRDHGLPVVDSLYEAFRRTYTDTSGAAEITGTYSP